MTSQEFRENLLSKRPRYAKSRIPVIEALANKGNKNSEYIQFGPIYELYIYAFTLGLKKGLKLPLPERSMTTDFLEIGKWKRDSRLVDFLLMIVFTHCKDIGFDWNDLEDMEPKELNSVMSEVVSFIESYANGGLEYLQTEWQDNNLINSHYLFVDLMAENTNFQAKIPEDNLKISEANDNLTNNTIELINKGESPTTEFKSTLRVCLNKTQKPESYVELGVVKTIAGFINTKKGTLIIGVADNKEVLGLETDFKSFGDKHDLLDEFQKHLDGMIEKYLGNSAFSLIALSFPEVEGKMVCRLDIDFKKNGPMYVRNKEKNSEEFYIRRAASTKALKTSEMVAYKENHWV